MNDIALVIAQIMLGAAIGESFCEFLVAPAWDRIALRLKMEAEDTQVVMRTLSATVGVLIALAYRLDIPGALGMIAWRPWIGQVLTGLVIGRGSNAAHEFLGKWVAQRQEAQAQALIASKSAHVAWSK